MSQETDKNHRFREDSKRSQTKAERKNAFEMDLVSVTNQITYVVVVGRET